MKEKIHDSEIWKKIDEFPNYEVSNKGRVKRVAFYKKCFNGPFKSEVRLLEKELILKPNDNGYGYMVVNLSKDRKRYSRYIHRLVAEAFISKPDGCNVVNHIDKNKKNNCSENLEWCTQKYNINHSKSDMKKQHNSKAGSTNIRYLSIRKNGRYRVNICNSKITIDKSFSTFEEAMECRREVLNAIGYTE